jgi:DNA-binding MarR family transcriptional regulator
MPQARPNVLFEAGLAFGRHPERTILVEFDASRPFSDVAGRHMIKISNDFKARQELVNRLRTAGCSVKTEGKTDWLTEGDFNTAVKEHSEKIAQEIASFKSAPASKDIVSIDKIQNDILRFITENSDKGFTVEDLASHFGMQIVRLQYHLDNIVSAEYLHTLLSIGAPPIYKLTQKGRAYIIKHMDEKYDSTIYTIIRQIKKMRGIGKKPTPKEIAEELDCSEDTVIAHLKKMHDDFLITYYASEGLGPNSELILGEKSFNPPFD